MRLLRLSIALLIVLGLTMPTARANVVADAAMAMEDCEGMSAMGGEDCPCCQKDDKCPANVCAMKCFKTVNTQPRPDVSFGGTWCYLGLPCTIALGGLELQPPAPPPRV